MAVEELLNRCDPGRLGQDMHDQIADLYSICRSITGNGVRETLKRLQGLVPIHVHEVASGTRVFDWTVPKEWNIRGGYLKTSSGKTIVDFRESNLHVLNYSVPVKRMVSLAELKPHLFTLPELPDAVPYRTSYYTENWGFCLPHRVYERLEEDQYEVFIDSTLENGSLSYGECFIGGETDAEALVSAHVCHPSLCNDNLSGVVLAAFIARSLGSVKTRLSYRILLIPGTIGSITWLSLNQTHASRIEHGLVLACVGDAGRPTYKKSRRGNAAVDRAVSHVLKHSGDDYAIEDFSPYGYDERQYCSPAFDLPVGCFSRTPYSRFPEYHTSADNLDFVRPEFLADSFQKVMAVFNVLEENRTYLNLNPTCEPQLGRRGLYRTMGGFRDAEVRELAMLWVLNLSDGAHSLLDIAERSGMRFAALKWAAKTLESQGLLKEYVSVKATPEERAKNAGRHST